MSFQRVYETITYMKVTDIINMDEEGFIPRAEVSDAQIKYYLDNEQFTDLQIEHKGLDDSSEIHAQRIASLIHLIQKNIKLFPINIYVVKGKYEIDDGYHRLRAYYYLNKPARVIVTIS